MTGRGCGNTALSAVAAVLLACFEPLSAQTPPITSGVAIGISEFDDVQIPKVPRADLGATNVGKALLGIGLAPRNVLVRTNREANTDAVRRALRTALQARATATDSVFVFIAGNGRIDTAGGSREAFLMTYDSNPGAKRTTAFRLAELAQLVRESPAAAIYLTIDLTGDRLQAELEALAKAPRVVLSAVASGSDLSLASAVARALSENVRQSSSTAGQLLELLRPAATTGQAYLAAQQPNSVLFSAPVVAVVKPPVDVQKTGVTKPLEETPPAEVPTAPPPVQGSSNTEAQRTAARIQNLLDTARADRDRGRWTEAIDNCKAALRMDANSSDATTLLWSVYSSQAAALIRERKWDEIKKNFDSLSAAGTSGPRLLELRGQTAGMLTTEGVSLLKQTKWDEAAVLFKMALALKPTAESTRGLNIAETHSAYEAGRAAFEKRDFATARDKFEQMLKAQSLMKDKDLTPLFVDAQSKSKVASTELLLNVGIEQVNSGQYASARVIFGRVLADDPSNERAFTQLGRLAQQGDLAFIDTAIRNGEQRLKNREWKAALADFQSALGKNAADVRALSGRQQAEDGIRREQRNLAIAGAGVGIPTLALLVIMAPAARRARVYARFGWDQRALRLFERILDRNPARGDALVSLYALYNSTGNRDAALDAGLKYLRMKPDDKRILTLVGETHFERREFEAAGQLFRRILSVDTANTLACTRLLAIEDQVPAEDPTRLSIYEQALETHPDSPELNRLVARYHVRLGERSPRALEIFRRALRADPGNADLHLACAEVFWAQGRFEDASTSAKEAFLRDPENPATRAIFLRASHKCSRLADALTLIDSGQCKGVRAVSLCEEIGAMDPGLRPLIHERYSRLLESAERDGLEGQIARALFRAHLSIDTESENSAQTHLSEAIAFDASLALSEGSVRELQESINDNFEKLPEPGPVMERGTSTIAKQEQVRVLCRFLDPRRDQTDFPQPFAGLVFRLGELHQELGDSCAALDAFKQIVRLPEWLVRCTTIMQDILDGLRIEELAGVFFQEVGWEARGACAGAEGICDLTVDPPAAAESSLFALFAHCKARCFRRPITLDDIVQLKRDLSDQVAINREFTFVVSPLRARQDVLALIYALLTEEPSLRVIPLEAVALKQAIIESKSADALEQLLRLWVGQGDLFDVHSPIADAGTFFGRGQFIHALTTKIIHRENFGIFGLRKVGKTSLVFQLRENLPKNLIGYADLQSISSRRCDEIYFRLSAALRRELRIKFPDLPPISSRLTEFDASKSYPAIASDFHAELLRVKEALESQGQQPRVLLLLDEIELLLPNNQSKGYIGYEDFFRQLRGLYQQEGFVLSGVIGADPNACRAGKWGDRDNPIFQYYDEIFLSPLDRTECDQMVQGIGEVMGVSFEPQSLTGIYDESGGHPYVARQLCSRIVTRHTQRPLRVSPSMVDDGVEDYIAQRPDYFIGVFRGYITSEARQLLEVTASSDENEVTRADLLAFSTKARLDRVLFDRALQDLELFHLLIRDRDRYHIKIRLLRRWIRRSWLGIE